MTTLVEQAFEYIRKGGYGEALPLACRAAFTEACAPQGRYMRRVLQALLHLARHLNDADIDRTVQFLAKRGPEAEAACRGSLNLSRAVYHKNKGSFSIALDFAARAYSGGAETAILFVAALAESDPLRAVQELKALAPGRTSALTSIAFDQYLPFYTGKYYLNRSDFEKARLCFDIAAARKFHQAAEMVRTMERETGPGPTCRL